MKVRVTELKKALGIVIPNIPNSTPMEILENIHMEYKNNKLTLKTTDLSSSTKFEFQPTEESDEISAVVPRLFYDLVSLLPNNEVADINVTINNWGGQKLTIDLPDKHYELPIRDAEEYPEDIKADSDTKSLKVNALKFGQALKKVAFATKKSDDIILRNAVVLVKFDESTLTFLGSDGTILSIAKLKLDADTGIKNSEINIDRQSVDLMISLCSVDEEHELNLLYTDTHVLIELQGISFISRLVKVKYPDVSKIIPTEVNHEIRVNRKELGRMNTLFSSLGEKETDRIEFRADGNKLSLITARTELREIVNKNKKKKADETTKYEEVTHESEHSIECRYKGDPISFIASSKALNRIIKSLSCEELILQIENNKRPLTILPRGEGGHTIIANLYQSRAVTQTTK